MVKKIRFACSVNCMVLYYAQGSTFDQVFGDSISMVGHNENKATIRLCL